MAADLIIQHRRVEGDSYIFKHALVRDAAYESMGTKELKIKHKKIACALISCSKKLGLNSLILIAEHFYQANEYDAALKYNVETLKHYTSISSNSMAIQIFEKIIFGKNFQENLCHLIMDDRPFADQIFEVLDINFLELTYLRVFVNKIKEYKKKYGVHPTRKIMTSILRTNISAGLCSALLLEHRLTNNKLCKLHMT